MRRRLTLTIGVLMLGVATLCGAGQQPEGQKPPTFRSALDVIAVDVQVVDRDGAPVPGLGPDKFEVTINGKRRRVLSAELVESRSATSLTPEERAVAVAGPPVRPTLARVVFIAVDCLSFDATASHHVIATAQQFIDRLPPTDEVGLFAYPYGPKISPTTDHAAVRRSLGTVMGQRDLPSHQFHLRPAEIVDLSGSAGFGVGGSALLQSVVTRECGDPAEATCQQRLMLEITGAALYYEGQGNAGLGMLRSLLEQVSVISGRKTLVLISAGMMASDVPGGRPNIGELGVIVGKEAARSNTSIYTLFLDTSAIDRFQAQVRGSDKNLQSEARDSEVLGRWLEQFSGAAGGALFKVQVGAGEQAFDRVLREISAYYMLGVEPADEDRDGRTHEIKVKASQKNLITRGSRWVLIPKRGAAASAAAAESAPSPAADSKEKPPVTPARVVPDDVQAVADAYDRGDLDFQRDVANRADLAILLRHFRGSDAPWPDAPRRTAVFALELGVAALQSGNQYARDEGGRLLAEYNARVRQPEGADAFECTWLWTEVAALEGLFIPDSAMLFVPRAVERCPGEARLQLAYAIISEQQWLRGTVGANEVDGILVRYQAAMKSPDTGAEARMRAAWFLCRIGRLDEALALADVRPPGGTDPYVRYLTELVRGQILRARGRPEDAAQAYRDALATWPGAQSARVALMTLVLSRGDRQEAAQLAEAAEAGSGSQFDPWWTYWLGDYRAYPAIVAKLRESAR